MFIVPANLIAAAPDFSTAALPSNVAKAGDTMTGALTVHPVALTTPLVAQGAAGFSGDLFEAQTSGAKVVARDTVGGDRYVGNRLYVVRADQAQNTVTGGAGYMLFDASDYFEFYDHVNAAAYLQVAGLVNPADQSKALLFPSAGVVQIQGRVALPAPIGIGIGTSAPAGALEIQGTSGRLITGYDSNSIRMTAQFNATQLLFGTENSGDLALMTNGVARLTLGSGGAMGFNGSSAIGKPAVTGSRGGNAALASLLTALASYGLVTDSSTA